MREVLAQRVDVLLVLAPLGGIFDPRDWKNDVLGGGPATTATGSELRLAASARWLEENIEPGDVVFPYSVVYFAALGAGDEASVLPYSQRTLVLRAAERIHTPVPRVIVAVPLGSVRLDVQGLREALGAGFEAHPFGAWLLIEGTGPYSDKRDALAAVSHALYSARDAVYGESYELVWYFRITLSALCGAVKDGWGDSCPPALAR